MKIHEEYNLQSVFGASLSEPHIDELNARDPYIIYIYLYGPSRANRHRHCTALRGIFQRPAMCFFC